MTVQTQENETMTIDEIMEETPMSFYGILAEAFPIGGILKEWYDGRREFYEKSGVYDLIKKGKELDLEYRKLMRELNKYERGMIPVEGHRPSTEEGTTEEEATGEVPEEYPKGEGVGKVPSKESDMKNIENIIKIMSIYGAQERDTYLRMCSTGMKYLKDFFEIAIKKGWFEGYGN